MQFIVLPTVSAPTYCNNNNIQYKDFSNLSSDRLTVLQCVSDVSAYKGFTRNKGSFACLNYTVESLHAAVWDFWDISFSPTLADWTK